MSSTKMNAGEVDEAAAVMFPVPAVRCARNLIVVDPLNPVSRTDRSVASPVVDAAPTFDRFADCNTLLLPSVIDMRAESPSTDE